MNYQELQDAQIFVCATENGHSQRAWMDLFPLSSLEEIEDEARATLEVDDDAEIEILDVDGLDWFYKRNEDGTPDLQEYYQLMDELNYLHESERDAFMAYVSEHNVDARKFEDRYMGQYDSEGDFVRSNFPEIEGVDSDTIERLENYIDWEAVSNDYFRYGDFEFIDGYVFRGY